MSKRVLDQLSDQFGRADCADCVVIFCIQQKEPTSNNAEPHIIGTLPAHRLILRASGRLRCESEGWDRYESSSQGAKRRRFDTQDNSVQGKPAAAAHGNDSGDPSAHGPRPDVRGLPELRVTLDREEELEPARTAVRYLYTQSLAGQQEQQEQQQQGPAQGVSSGAHPGSGLSVGELVVVAKVAEFLDIVDCAEACYDALVECFEGALSSSSSSSISSPASPLAPVLELYSFRHLLPSPDHHPGVGPVLAACRKYLLRHWAAQLPPTAAGCSASPTKGDLLAWLLGGGDAVRIANDSQLLQLWTELPAVALEELLQSDHLSTDDEATVVFLVEEWVLAGGSGVTEEDAARVRRELRLVNCNTCYRHDVLPKLPWLGPDPGRQAAFLNRCREAHRSEWEHMGNQLGGYDTSSPWYGKPRPQSVPEEGVSYTWEVSREGLLEGLTKEGTCKRVTAMLQQHGGDSKSNSQSVAALGYEWELNLTSEEGGSHAGLFVYCHIPAAIEAQAGKLEGACRVCCAVEMPAGDSQTVELTITNKHLIYGKGLGTRGCLSLLNGAGPPAAQQGQAEGAADSDAALLAPWSKLLGPEGKIKGTLTFHRPGL